MLVNSPKSFLIIIILKKVVYVARNPKDVILSYFHYHKLFRVQQFNGNLESFADYFMTDKGNLTL